MIDFIHIKGKRFYGLRIKSLQDCQYVDRPMGGMSHQVFFDSIGADTALREIIDNKSARVFTNQYHARSLHHALCEHSTVYVNFEADSMGYDYVVSGVFKEPEPDWGDGLKESVN